MKRIVLAVLVCFSIPLFGQNSEALTGQSGEVTFVSEAPLELIIAQSDNLEGVIVPSSGRFAFRVEVISFEGFNNPLQRIHFQENYMEIHEFPVATFEGRILDELPWSNPGKYQVRAKGRLNLHGITKERIINGELLVTADGIVVNSMFTIALEDHEILVPRIVHQKIAEEIKVELSIELK